ncbi:hypothetical protein MIR68_010146 [Amoeboaphelidium protococcarum]|nr:hypothetical protein MIR68_010146 [Amoeboaphelidium protococcarum]
MSINPIRLTLIDTRQQQQQDSSSHLLLDSIRETDEDQRNGEEDDMVCNNAQSFAYGYRDQSLSPAEKEYVQNQFRAIQDLSLQKSAKIVDAFAHHSPSGATGTIIVRPSVAGVSLHQIQSPVASRSQISARRFKTKEQIWVSTSGDGVISNYNDTAESMFGSDVVSGKGSILDFVQGSDTVLNDLRRLPNAATAVFVETSRKSGNQKHLIKSGQIVQVVHNGAVYPYSCWLTAYADNGIIVKMNWVLEKVDGEVTFEFKLDERNQISRLDCSNELFLNQVDIVQLSKNVQKLSDDYLIVRVHGHNVPARKIRDDQRHVIHVKIVPKMSGMIMLDSASLVIVNANQAFLNYIFGYQLADIIKMNGGALSAIIANVKQLEDVISLIDSKSPTSASTQSSVSTQSPVLSPVYIDSVLSGSKEARLKLTAIHKTGAQFELTADIRLISRKSSQRVALWLTYELPAIIRSTEQSKEKEKTVDQSLKQERSSVEPKEPQFSELAQLQGLTAVSPIDEIDNKSKAQSLSDYEIVQRLGEGAFGSVYLVQNKLAIDGKQSVLKFIIQKKVRQESWYVDAVTGERTPLEVQILQELSSPRLQHPNIVQLKNVFKDRHNFYLEMPLYGRGMDLFDYVDLKLQIPEWEVHTIFKQVCSAVNHLHMNGIVHRDIKDENIIIDSNMQIQIIDFGSACHYDEKSQFKAFCGTLDYISPEVLKGQFYNGPPQDIWALGVLLHILIYKDNPFHSMDEVIKKTIKVPFVLSAGSNDLLQRLLKKNLNDRIKMAEIMNHPWIQQKYSAIDSM